MGISRLCPLANSTTTKVGLRGSLVALIDLDIEAPLPPALKSGLFSVSMTTQLNPFGSRRLVRVIMGSKLPCVHPLALYSHSQPWRLNTSA